MLSQTFHFSSLMLDVFVIVIAATTTMIFKETIYNKFYPSIPIGYWIGCRLSVVAIRELIKVYKNWLQFTQNFKSNTNNFSWFSLFISLSPHNISSSDVLGIVYSFIYAFLKFKTNSSSTILKFLLILYDYHPWMDYLVFHVCKTNEGRSLFSTREQFTFLGIMNVRKI